MQVHTSPVLYKTVNISSLVYKTATSLVLYKTVTSLVYKTVTSLYGMSILCKFTHHLCITPLQTHAYYLDKFHYFTYNSLLFHIQFFSSLYTCPQYFLYIGPLDTNSLYYFVFQTQTQTQRVCSTCISS
jgi:hypothetical protein